DGPASRRLGLSLLRRFHHANDSGRRGRVRGRRPARLAGGLGPAGPGCSGPNEGPAGERRRHARSVHATKVTPFQVGVPALAGVVTSEPTKAGTPTEGDDTMRARREFVMVAAGTALAGTAATFEASAQTPTKEKAEAPPETPRQFPKGFFWGTA